MRAIAELATVLDLVRLRAPAVLDPDELVDVDAIARRVEDRRGFVGDTFVAALVGGTGAGKSSLLNAIAGSEVSSVSAVRPHTDRALALTPQRPSSDLVGFLDDMGIDDRVPVRHLDSLSILDLPDQDSTALSHRRMVWDLLPEVDAIVWVVDPDKYHDAEFLGDYVAALAGYQDQALFVLNKADLLSEGEVGEVEADLVGQLEVAGIVEPRVFVTAAAPPHRAPIGVEAVVEHLSDQMDAKRVRASKALADVASAVSLLARRARLDRGWDLGFEARWGSARDEATAALDSGDGDRAVAVIDAFVTSLISDVAPPFARKLIGAVPADDVSRRLLAASAAPAEDVGKKRRRRPAAVREAPSVDLDDLVASPLRSLLWDRAYLGATLAAASVQVAQARTRLRR